MYATDMFEDKIEQKAGAIPVEMDKIYDLDVDILLLVLWVPFKRRYHSRLR